MRNKLHWLWLAVLSTLSFIASLLLLASRHTNNGNGLIGYWIALPAGALMFAAALSWYRVNRSANTKPSVFIICSHNPPRLVAITTAFATLGIRTQPWDQVRNKLGVGEAHNWNVFKAAVRTVDAVIVLLTPDDEATLSSELWHYYIGADHGTVKQPRQNVVLELGYMLALKDQGECSVIIFRVDDPKIPSDLDGFNHPHIGGPRGATFAGLEDLFRQVGIDANVDDRNMLGQKVPC